MEKTMSEEDVEIKDPKAVLAALERAKEDAKKYREQYEALAAEHDPVKAELDKVKGYIRDTAIERAIEEAGADPKRVMQFIKTDSIKYADGKLEGFDEEFTKVKTALPELFDPKRRVGGRVESEINGDPNHVKSVSEMQAERLLGNIKRG
jgi:hypothetical protein